jgi:signal transduction histidine kinase
MATRLNVSIAAPDLTWPALTGRISTRNRRLAALLANSRRSSGNVAEALERERQRIAQDLHAGAGQPLSGMQVNLDLLQEFLEDPAGSHRASAEKALQRLRRLASEASGQVRAVSHRLHPPEWQQLPLADAIRQLIDSSGLIESLNTEVKIGSFPGNLSHPARVALYRCAQECIANIVRHSGATRVVFEAGSDDAEIWLRVTDNGGGFSPQPAGEGIGLRAMRAHAEGLGGACRIRTSPHGTSITMQLPLGPETLVQE